MVLSDVSIRRPVLASVISLMLCVLGAAAFLKLPVREYPAIDPPIVSVVTVYKGASNEVMESRITELIEGTVAGIEGVKRITSSSREERSSVTVEFHLSRNVDAAAADVRDKVARILTKLPESADAPIIAKVDSDARAILWFSLRSDRMPAMEITDYAARVLIDRLSVLPGVANVYISGERRFSMRVWLDRRAMAARQVTVDDVEQAIKRQNIELPSGRLESVNREFVVKTDSRLSTPEEFREVIVATRQGYQVRLGEVAKVELSPEDDRGEYRANGETTIGLGIVRQSTANTLSVAAAGKAEMDLLAPSFPEGMSYLVGYDESIFIERSIFEVYHALGIGILLVICVIFFFLRSWRATLIPAIAIPVSIIASFIVMGALGFSINVLTLLALVLAIGIVVDDAIVVLENVHRRIEAGEPPLIAALHGSRQITFAVISATLTLTAVFVPISFMEGRIGRLFSEFGISLAAAVVFSGVVALTLTPMLCSKILAGHGRESRFVRVTEGFFIGMNNGYRWLLKAALGAPILVLALGVAIAGSAFFFWQALPKEFAPVEDRSNIIIPSTAPEGATIDYMRGKVATIEKMVWPLLENKEATVILSIVAPGLQRPSPVNTGITFIKLVEWDKRTRSQQTIVRELFPKLQAIPGVRASAINRPSLGQRGFQPPMQLVIGGSDYASIKEWVDRVIVRGQADGRFLNLDTNYKETKPELRVQVDRRKAADLGIPVETVGRAMEAMFGSREVGTYVDRGEEYKVIIQARAEDRSGGHDLANVFVRSTTTQQLIPLSNLVTLRESAGPADLPRTDRIRSIIISASLAPGFVLGDALDEMEKITKAELPLEAIVSYEGQSLEYKESSSSLYFTFGLALLIVYLVLAAQFESFIHPAVIMLAVPLAVTGGLAALYVTGNTLNVYSQIGMILLIGVMTKNGILIVEFANQLRDQGQSIYDAVVEAAVVRLRPIIMTAIATAIGALPLAIATGAGAESRAVIGVVVIGGVALSTLLTGFVVPVLYFLVARFTKPISYVAAEITRLEHRHAPAQ